MLNSKDTPAGECSIDVICHIYMSVRTCQLWAQCQPGQTPSSAQQTCTTIFLAETIACCVLAFASYSMVHTDRCFAILSMSCNMGFITPQ